MNYTPETLIADILNKTTKTNNTYLSLKTTEGLWFNVFDAGQIQVANQAKASNLPVVISYEMNGQYTDLKNINIAQTPAPPQVAQVQPQDVPAPPLVPDTKREDILRSVALKASVALVCADKNKLDLFAEADGILGWLKNEKPNMPITPTTTPTTTAGVEVDISMDEIPF